MLFIEIPLVTRDLGLVQQDRYAIIFCEEYEGIIDLVDGKFEQIYLRDTDGNLLDITGMTETTIRWIEEFQRGNIQNPPCITELYKLQIVSDSKVAASDYLRMRRWQESERSSLRDRGVNESDILRVTEGLPNLWKVNINGNDRGRIISREDPIIIHFWTYCYVFVTDSADTLKVYRYTDED